MATGFWTSARSESADLIRARPVRRHSSAFRDTVRAEIPVVERQGSEEFGEDVDRAGFDEYSERATVFSFEPDPSPVMGAMPSANEHLCFEGNGERTAVSETANSNLDWIRVPFPALRTLPSTSDIEGTYDRLTNVFPWSEPVRNYNMYEGDELLGPEIPEGERQSSEEFGEDADGAGSDEYFERATTRGLELDPSRVLGVLPWAVEHFGFEGHGERTTVYERADSNLPSPVLRVLPWAVDHFGFEGHGEPTIVYETADPNLYSSRTLRSAIEEFDVEGDGERLTNVFPWSEPMRNYNMHDFDELLGPPPAPPRSLAEFWEMLREIEACIEEAAGDPVSIDYR